MVSKLSLKLLSATAIRRSLPLFAIALAFFPGIEISQHASSSSLTLEVGQQAQARSSGGRSGGGSFKRKSSGSSSGSSKSRPSNRNSSNNSSSSSRSSGTNVIVVPGSGSSYNSGGSRLGMFIILGLFGVVGLIVVASILSGGSNASSTSTANVPSVTELENDIVTISKLQVALFADATKVQSQLSELSLHVNTDTEEGVLELLQESVLVLLRHSEHWSHVLSSSESIRIDAAEQAFSKLSFAERSKFSAETLTNVNGRKKAEEVVAPTDEDSAAYIVVTLLAGTADDKPLFGDIHSLEALKEALERVAAVPADYLMKFELLWSPQAENDSLTYDELLTEYTNMIQLV